MNEHQTQVNLVNWFRVEHPELTFNFFSIPNGGKRTKVTAMLLKLEGMLAGVPDLFLAVPNQKYHGLFIELKTIGGCTSKAQDAVHTALKMRGYAVYVPYGYFEAIKLIGEYLNDRVS